MDNGIPVHAFNIGVHEVMMIKFVFRAGKWFNSQPLLPSFTCRMLREGTSNYTTQEIANEVEFYGATLKTKCSNYFSYVTLYSLTRHLPAILPLIKDILINSNFPEKELQTILQNSRQNLLVSKEKVGFLADERFNNLYFGENHPYGKTTSLKDYDEINREELQAFYKANYKSNNCQIYLAGKLPKDIITQLNQLFGGDDWSGDIPKVPKYTLPTFQHLREYTNKPKAVQAAVRFAIPLFNKTHTDFPQMFILNTILGGYFGSRLVANLRENKGYTYGIYSTIVSYLQYGFFYVSTEVKAEVWEETLDEIIKEINRLKEDVVEREELLVVRNYLLGSLLSNVDGAFNLISSFQGVNAYGMTLDFYHQLVQAIKTTSNEQLQTMAKTYLNTDQSLQVIIGA